MRRIGILGVGLLGNAVASRLRADLSAVITTLEYLAGLRPGETRS
jgi:hypothetical protein